MANGEGITRAEIPNLVKYFVPLLFTVPLAAVGVGTIITSICTGGWNPVNLMHENIAQALLLNPVTGAAETWVGVKTTQLLNRAASNAALRRSGTVTLSVGSTSTGKRSA